MAMVVVDEEEIAAIYFMISFGILFYESLRVGESLWSVF
jgi:hypothetical protein